MQYHLLELALDADLTNKEIKAGLIPTRALFTDVKELTYPSELKPLSSHGIYERGHGGYKETISFWKRQREAIVSRLLNFGRNLEKIGEAEKIIEEAKKDNPNGLPF
jgi:hypothetical protein